MGDVTAWNVIAVLVGGRKTGGTTGVGVPVAETTPDGPTSTLRLTLVQRLLVILYLIQLPLSAKSGYSSPLAVRHSPALPVVS